jgi:hypothetical protein
MITFSQVGPSKPTFHRNFQLALNVKGGKLEVNNFSLSADLTLSAMTTTLALLARRLVLTDHYTVSDTRAIETPVGRVVSIL